MKSGLSVTNEHAPARGAHTLTSRRLIAVAVACVALAALGVGWLADSAASYISAPTDGSMSRQAGLLRVTLSMSPVPLRAGQQEQFTVRVVDVSGHPVLGAAVRCTLSMPTMEMTLAPSVATPTAVTGDYSCSVTLPHSGHWSFAVSVESAGQPPAQTTFALAAT